MKKGRKPGQSYRVGSRFCASKPKKIDGDWVVKTPLQLQHDPVEKFLKTVYQMERR